jgi:lysophospholipase L1-like esterase
MLLQKNDVFLLTGDSVTDCGRDRSENNGPETIEGMGSGYAGLVKAFLNAHYPELSLTVKNKGISGNRTPDILNRMESDHLSLSPFLVSILIGINDVWRHFDSPNMVQVEPDEYLANMHKIIASFKTSARQVIVLAPFYLTEQADHPMLAMAREYGALAKQAASENGALFVDLQAIFDELMQNAPASRYAGDGVHPNLYGHMVIAKALLDVVLK